MYAATEICLLNTPARYRYTRDADSIMLTPSLTLQRSRRYRFDILDKSDKIAPSPTLRRDMSLHNATFHPQSCRHAISCHHTLPVAVYPNLPPPGVERAPKSHLQSLTTKLRVGRETESGDSTHMGCLCSLCCLTNASLQRGVNIYSNSLPGKVRMKGWLFPFISTD